MPPTAPRAPRRWVPARWGLIAWAASALLFPLFYGTDWLPNGARSDFRTLWLAVQQLGTSRLDWAYPPQMLFPFGLLAQLPLGLAFHLWNALTALLFFLAARPWLPPGIPRILALLTPAAVINLYFGQFGLFIGALWLWTFRRAPWAGALLTVKPHLALLGAIPILSDWRLTLRTAAVMGAIVALSIAVFGLDPWRLYAAQLFNNGSRFAQAPPLSFIIYGVTPLMGYPAWAWLIFAAAAAWLLSWNCHVFTAATATFLISPYGFGYDMPVVCLGFALLLSVHWREMDWGERLFATLAFLVPVLGRFGTWPQPFILLLGLWVQVRIQRPTLGFHWGTGRTTLLGPIRGHYTN